MPILLEFDKPPFDEGCPLKYSLVFQVSESLLQPLIVSILVEKFLSQISVYNRIRGAIDGKIGGSLLFDISHEVGNLKLICKRSGPAFTIIVESKGDKKHGLEQEEELFHCDFTFALFCPKFPQCAQDNEK